MYSKTEKPHVECAQCGKSNIAQASYNFCVSCGAARPETEEAEAQISSEALSDEEKPQPMRVQLYDVLHAFGVERNGVVVYVAEPLLKVLELDLKVLASWNESLCHQVDDVIPPGETAMRRTHVLSRVGLLKAIASSSTEASLKILQHVAAGLHQFDLAEKAVRHAEAMRLKFVREEKRAKESAVSQEFAEWEAEMDRKRKERQRRREERKRLEAKLFEQGAEKGPSLLDKYAVEKEKRDKESKLRSTRMQQLKQARQLAEAQQIEAEEKLLGIEREPVDAALDEEPEAEALVHEDDLLRNDPTRVMADVPVPTAKRLDIDELFRDGGEGPPRLTLLRAHFQREGRLTERCCKELLKRARKVLSAEENLLELSAPIHLFGDIHGQYFDLCELLKKAGSPKDKKQLWLGDYVDRGAFGCEVALLLLAAKVKYPDRVFMLRGNHESRSQTKVNNFEREATNKYSADIYNEFMLTFDALPLTAVVDTLTMGRFYCAHGGLSPMIRRPQDILRVERFEEPPDYGPVCDVLWSDPADLQIEGASEREKQAWLEVDYEDNDGRGCGVVYGVKAAERFLEDNELVCIVRAHEVMKDGYKEHRFMNSTRPMPMVVTLFSAPNYVGTYENRAAWMTIKDELPYQFSQIAWVEDKPYALPDASNVFDMSLPIIAESITGFFLAILEQLTADDDEEEQLSRESQDQETAKRLRSKVLNIGRTMAALRAERKQILHTVSQGQDALGEVSSSEEAFEKSRKLDRVNEMNLTLLRKTPMDSK